MTIADLARRVVSSFGNDVKIISGTAPAGETSRRCPDISKLQNMGYQPPTSLDSGLSKTIKWYLENLHLKPLKY